MSRLCGWCRRELEPTARSDARFCSRRCRQAAFRVRRRWEQGVAPAGRRRVVEGGRTERRIARVDASDECIPPGRFAYADPPYPGRARKYYRDVEVDHRALIASLEASGYVGWALSTSADALHDVLPLCPRWARVCAWVKPIGASSRTYGLHNCWEPLIVVGGRRRRPGTRDWLSAQPARFNGTLPGRKPIAFCAWLFECLGMEAGDELVDLFPGTGVVSRAWDEVSSDTAVSSDASLASTRATAA